jgi:hypothetical protein
MLNLYIQISKYLIVASGRIWRKVLSTIPNEHSSQQFFKLTIDLSLVYKFTIDLTVVYKPTIDLTVVYKVTIDLTLV